MTELPYTDMMHGITYRVRPETKNPTIYADFHHNGKRYKISTKTADLKQAVIFATKKKNDVVSGKSLKVVTFREALQSFIETKKSQNKSPLTIDDYERQGKYCLEFFDNGRTPVTEIGSDSIIKLREWRKTYYLHHPRKKKQRSYVRAGKQVRCGRMYNTEVGNRALNKTTGLAVMVVRHAWKHMKAGIAESELPYHEPLREKSREVFVTKQELKRITDYFISIDNEYYAYLVAFVFFTGARYPSEVNRLEWRDVNFDEGIMVFLDRKSKRSEPLDTVVPILPDVDHILSRLREEVGDNYKKYSKVFVDKDGRQVKNIRVAFKKAVIECDLDPELTMYSLRHSAITNWIVNYDMPAKMISEIVGHVDTVMVDRIYSHLKKNENAKAFVRRIKKVDSLRPGEPMVITPVTDLYRLTELENE